MNVNKTYNSLFNISTDNDFNDIAINIFHQQYAQNQIYRSYVDLHVKDIHSVKYYTEIPFLPIEFFKSFSVICKDKKPQIEFHSSGTTGHTTSKHLVSDLFLYEKSFLRCFELFYGNPEDYIFLAILPSYLERENSSLIYMVDKLIRKSGRKESGFFLDNLEELVNKINGLKKEQIILLGVSYALLDLAEKYDLDLSNVIVMETGGMKGRRKEMIREELHQYLCTKFNVAEIHSEYGMTELLSQAYSKENGIFKTPPWMKVLIRDINDPLTLLADNLSGGVNIIDLANIHSCSFIASQDLGRTYKDGSFEILGRFDTSDIRGCNLLIS